MVAILLLTDTFRSNIAVSRWRDAVWLAWLAAPLYWIHQLEEYSLPLLGFDYNLPDMVAKNIGFPPYPECPFPMVFYPVVNIALMWFGAPLAAYLCKRNLVLGLSYWGLIFANGLVHTMGGVTQHITTPACGAAPFCLFRCPSGSSTLWCLAAHTAARSSPCHSSAEPSPMHCFSSATGSQGRGDKRCGLGGLCRPDWFHAAHLGGPCEPVLQA